MFSFKKGNNFAFSLCTSK